jgi:GTP-binding protein
MLIKSANFLKSASKPSEGPLEDFPEFAFIGRSNVGKSSLINMLTQRKQLAKVSVTPGKTALINYFIINNNRYLVDLPGYGYAKKSKAQRMSREKVMWDYFRGRPTLKTVFLLIDGSILPQHIDLEFIE